MAVQDSSLFERLSALLDPLNPAELHGLLCGLLCIDATLDHERWLSCVGAALADEGELPPAFTEVLVKLLEFGAAQMSAAEGSVAPLLPDDDTPLRQRVSAVGDWCQGLLYGLGLGQVAQRGDLSDDSWEFLRDAAEIAQIGFDAAETGEADEMAYVELVEYLRVGLLTLQQDLQPRHPPFPARLH